MLNIFSEIFSGCDYTAAVLSLELAQKPALCLTRNSFPVLGRYLFISRNLRLRYANKALKTYRLYVHCMSTNK